MTSTASWPARRRSTGRASSPTSCIRSSSISAIWAACRSPSGQLTLLGNAAINACDLVGGQHLGYIEDPSECRYDPTRDANVLCTASGGINTSADCVSTTQAQAMNKLWYGQTRDGSVPSPAVDNSWAHTLDSNHLWYGLTRGTSFGGLGGSTTAGVPAPFTIATDMVALENQNPTLATPSFQNPTGNGTNGWLGLSYAQLGDRLRQRPAAAAAVRPHQHRRR